MWVQNLFILTFVFASATAGIFGPSKAEAPDPAKLMQEELKSLGICMRDYGGIETLMKSIYYLNPYWEHYKTLKQKWDTTKFSNLKFSIDKGFDNVGATIKLEAGKQYVWYTFSVKISSADMSGSVIATGGKIFPKDQPFTFQTHYDPLIAQVIINGTRSEDKTKVILTGCSAKVKKEKFQVNIEYPKDANKPTEIEKGKVEIPPLLEDELSEMMSGICESVIREPIIGQNCTTQLKILHDVLYRNGHVVVKEVLVK